MPRRLAVAIVAKDNAATIGRLIRGIAGLRGAFDEVAFSVYENNSADGTKDALRRLSRDIPRFTLVSEDLSRERQAEIAKVRHKDGRVCRIEILAYARERARSLALGEYGDYEYVLVADADAVLFSFASIARAAGAIESGSCDCVCANGLTKRLLYRDAFAFRSKEHPFGPEFLGDYWTDVVRKRIQGRLRGRLLVPAYSAFGGAALFSMDAYRAGRYAAIPDAEYLRQQRALDFSAANDEELRRASPEPVPNTNFLSPIVCEHVPFCYAMRAKGFGRIFIDPRWRIFFLD